MFRTKGSESHNFVPSTSRVSTSFLAQIPPTIPSLHPSSSSSSLKTRDSTRPGNESFVCGPVLLIVPRIIYSPWRASLPDIFPILPTQPFFRPSIPPPLTSPFPFTACSFFYTRSPPLGEDTSPEGRCTLSPNSIPLLSLYSPPV